MTVHRLDHITITTHDIFRSVTFYHQVLGLTQGSRPRFAGLPQGAWLYSEDRPVIHLLLDERRAIGSGRVDHVAFSGVDLQGFRENLDRLEIPYQEIPPSDDVLCHQVFVEDPNGVAVEINFL